MPAKPKMKTRARRHRSIMIIFSMTARKCVEYTRSGRNVSGECGSWAVMKWAMASNMCATRSDGGRSASSKSSIFIVKRTNQNNTSHVHTLIVLVLHCRQPVRLLGWRTMLRTNPAPCLPVPIAKRGNRGCA